jgi:hypothetical protein
VDIYSNLNRTFYTVVPVNADGTEAHAPGAVGTDYVNNFEIDKMDYIFRAMVDRNAWVMEQVAEPAYVLFRKTRGEACICRKETGQPRTACPVCLETGIVGGYYGPYDFPFIDPDSGAMRTLKEGGVDVERQSRSYLGPSPVVNDGDLIVRRNGERIVISNVTYKMPRGVLLQQEYDCQLLKRGDVRYLIPLNTREPILFNPSDPAAVGNEPVTDPKTEPEKQWENSNKPKGRTNVFARIQT